MIKKFLVVAAIAVMTPLVLAGFYTTMKLARASSNLQGEVSAVNKGADTAIVEAMRSCIVTVSTQGLTNAGIDQAYRLCWNRAELVGKTHKEK